LEEITFCFWAVGKDDSWTTGKVRPPKGKDPDGAETVLACFGRNFRRWANEYYGEELDGPALDHVWRGRDPIDWATLEALNVDFDERAVREEAELLDWPLDLSKRSAPPKKTKAKPRAKRASDEAPTSAVRRPTASFGAASAVSRDRARCACARGHRARAQSPRWPKPSASARRSARFRVRRRTPASASSFRCSR
ncbi:MAG: hypothetical protein K0S65_997, partial [Labilithrix sp.]|nr:hypothetical protein [Labilithrix sp.]